MNTSTKLNASYFSLSVSYNDKELIENLLLLIIVNFPVSVSIMNESK